MIQPAALVAAVLGAVALLGACSRGDSAGTASAPATAAAPGSATTAASPTSTETATATSTSTATSTATGTATGAATGAATPTATASGEKWAVSLALPGALRAGATAAARLRVEARGGFHVNKDYPLAFTPAPDLTTDLASGRILLAAGLERIPCSPGSEDACAVVATVPFTPRVAGGVRVAGTLAFSVCSAEICLIEKVALVATGEATPP